MFEIEYKGGNGLIIGTKRTKLHVDPRLSVVGLKDLKTKDEIELVTEARFAVENSEARVIIQSPGEYEVGDFTIRGIAATRHIDMPSDEKLSTIYRVEAGDFAVGVIGNIKDKLDDDQLETIGVVDVLVIPIGGGGYTLDATTASAIARQVEPKVVIPIHYADTGLRYEVPQDSLETFIKEFGAPVDESGSFKLKAAAALPAVMTVMPLTRTN